MRKAFIIAFLVSAWPSVLIYGYLWRIAGENLPWPVAVGMLICHVITVVGALYLLEERRRGTLH